MNEVEVCSSLLDETRSSQVFGLLSGIVTKVAAVWEGTSVRSLSRIRLSLSLIGRLRLYAFIGLSYAVFCWTWATTLGGIGRSNTAHCFQYLINRYKYC
jgi:hypothetical protein